MDRRIDIAVAIAALLFGIFVAYETALIKAGIYRDVIGSRQFLYGCAFILIVGAATIIVRRLVGWQKSHSNLVQSEGVSDEEGYPSSILRAAALFFCCLIYALLFEPLGYLLATPLFLFAALFTLRQRNFILMALIAIGFTVVFYYIFAILLDVRLPVGPFTEWFRAMGWVVY